MPLYEYRCGECETEFEAFVTFEEGHTTPCPKCHRLATKKFSRVNWTSTWVLDSLKDDVPRRWEDPYH